MSAPRAIPSNNLTALAQRTAARLNEATKLRPTLAIVLGTMIFAFKQTIHAKLMRIFLPLLR